MMKKVRNYRLGLDLGSTSLGWCMLELDESGEACGIIDMGVRIFDDGRDDKSKMPLSVKRRVARGIRRNHDRFLERRKILISLMTENKMLDQEAVKNKEVFKKNPYMLRSKGLDNALSLSEFARAVLHLAQRRGFKSNRKDSSKESQSMKKAIENSKSLMQKYNARSMGELLYKIDQSQRIQHKKESIRFKYEKKSEKTDLLFPSRAMMEEEFNLLWDTQKAFHSILTDNLKKEFYDVIFFQRPLKPQIPGQCYLIPENQCAPKSSLYFQEFRLLSFMNNLKLTEISSGQSRELTDNEYQKLYEYLSLREKTDYVEMRKKVLGKKDNYDAYRFNYEKSASEKVYGNEVNALFYKKEIKSVWEVLDFLQQESIINHLLSHELDETGQ